MPHHPCKCESASRRFQPGEGPSRGLLRDCEIFGNIRITFVSSTNLQAVGLGLPVGLPRPPVVPGPGAAVVPPPRPLLRAVLGPQVDAALCWDHAPHKFLKIATIFVDEKIFFL